MFARVVTVGLKPDTTTQVSQFFQGSVGPALRQQQGFHSSRFLVDGSSNKCLVVTLWLNEADLKASESSGFLKEQLGHLSQFFASAPSIERYENMVQMMA